MLGEFNGTCVNTKTHIHTKSETNVQFLNQYRRIASPVASFDTRPEQERQVLRMKNPMKEYALI
jgi:hypothetical protein